MLRCRWRRIERIGYDVGERAVRVSHLNLITGYGTLALLLTEDLRVRVDSCLDLFAIAKDLCAILKTGAEYHQMFAFAESIRNDRTRRCARLRYRIGLPTGEDEAGTRSGTGILLHRIIDIAIACAVCACGYGDPVFAGVRRPRTTSLRRDGEIPLPAGGCEIRAGGINLKSTVCRAGLIDRVSCRANGNCAASSSGAGVCRDCECNSAIACAGAVVDGYPIIRATRCRPVATRRGGDCKVEVAAR